MSEEAGKVEVIRSEVHRLLKMNEDQIVELRRLNSSIYGNEDRPGLNTRLTVLEGKFQMIWAAIAVIGSAALVALINVIVGFFKS